MHMNNFNFFVCIIFFSFLSCRENENKFNNQGNLNSILIDSSLIIEKDLTAKEVKVEKQILPDTTVNNKLMLSNDKSLKRFYSNEVRTLERIRESPVVVFTNKDNSEYLIAYQYEGGIKNSYDCFEFGFLKDDESLGKISKFKTSEIKFKTESKISLGLNFDQIINLKGLNYKTEINKNLTTVIYRNTDYDNSLFLKRYNMPSYFMEFTLKDDKLIKVKYGFDYP
jgi:hypothetical protein